MATKVKMVLTDLREDVVSAWRDQFDECPEVEVRRGDVFAAGTDALVLPGNAFGFLDRGLELAVCERFGWEVQDALRNAARNDFHGELLVGQACFTPLGPPFGQLIYTCIYRTPRKVADTVNVFLATRGAFLALQDADSPPVGSVVFPGIGTGNCGVEPLVSARQMRYAYELYSGRRGFGDKNISQLSRRERKLCSLPKSALDSKETEDAS